MADEASLSGAPLNERPWIAYLDKMQVPLACGRDQVHWYYSSFVVLSAQKLGASGIIVVESESGRSPTINTAVVPSGVLTLLQWLWKGSLSLFLLCTLT